MAVFEYSLISYKKNLNQQIKLYNMSIKRGPKKIATSTGKPDKRQRDNKQVPKNTPTLKPHVHKKGN